MYRRLLAFDIILSKCKSQLHGSDWKVTPNNFRHGLRSIETRGAGKALVDLPLRSISHVFLKFSCIRLADVHATIDRTSSAAKLPLLASDFTGILNVKSTLIVYSTGVKTIQLKNDNYNKWQFKRDTGCRTLSWGPLSLYNRERFISFQQYSSLEYRTREIWIAYC